jgi:hypothetical protein
VSALPGPDGTGSAPRIAGGRAEALAAGRAAVRQARGSLLDRPAAASRPPVARRRAWARHAGAGAREHRVREAALVLAGYAFVSALLFGRGVLPRLGSALEGSGAPGFHGRDQSAYVWFLDWAARAIAHLQDPLSTNAIYTPHGWNLAWAASMPGPSALLSPLTLLAGPIVAFNVLALCAPAFAGWSAYLLCRALAPGRAWPAVAGGALFGFGTYETVEMVNHVSLALVGLVPLAPLLVLLRHRGRLTRRAFILALGVLAAAQVLTSTEVLASMVLFGALAFALWLALAGGAARRAIVRTGAEALGALAVAGLLSVPFLYQAFHFGNPIAGVTQTNAGVDLASLLSAPRTVWLPGVGSLLWNAHRVAGDITEQNGYLGLPLLAMLVLFAWSFRRSLAGRLLVAFALAVLVLALGGTLIVDGHFTHQDLPWGALAKLPLLRFAMPSRFLVYLWLAIAVAGCLWLAAPGAARRPARWMLFALVAASLVPRPAAAMWSTRVSPPPLLVGPALTRYVPRGSTVLTVPIGIAGESMLWQVEAGFRFRLAGGYVSFVWPPDYLRWLGVIEALDASEGAHTRTPALCAFLRQTGTRTILVRAGYPGEWRRILAPLGVTPIEAGGFWIYRLAGSRATSTAC